jgi:DNA primase
MGGYTKESLEILRQKIDLFEVLASFIHFSRAGANYKALCPFHEEKTPSFILQRGDTHYHCYGCGAHGDAISFLMTYQKMSFAEAVQYLADKFNVVLEETNVTVKGPSKNALKEALLNAAHFYHFYLLYTKEGHEALEYLYQRGIDIDFIKKFCLGLAPQDKTIFQRFMQEMGINKKVLQDAGLTRVNFGGDVSDFFYERIVIPISDSMSNYIGFSARKFKETTFGPKYVNTAETLLFKKSKILFGLNFCRRTIAKERKAIIVEGQIDAMRLIYAGFDITVASQGTAFGESHLKELINLGVNNVFLAFDPDSAGEEAALKVGDICQRNGVGVVVVKLPQGCDPDLTIRDKGPLYFTKLLETAVPYLQFLVDKFSKTLNVKTPTGKAEMVQTIARRIKEWGQPLIIHESMKKLAEITSTPAAMIDIAPEAICQVYATNNNKEKVDGDEVLEKDLLRWLFVMGGEKEVILKVAINNLTKDIFKTESCRRLYEKYIQIYADKGVVDLLSFANNFSEEEEAFFSSMLSKKINREKSEEIFIDTVQKVLDRKWLQEREEIKQRIQSGTCNEAEVMELARKFDEIKKRRPQIVR